MKAGEIQKCAACHKGVMHTRLPLFYTATIQRHGVNTAEVQRAAGMEQFMGGHVALARVFHDPDITEPITEPVQLFLCEHCADTPQVLAALLTP